MLPSGAVQAHQHLSWWEMDQKERQKDLHGQLLIVHGAFDAPFLGLQ